MLPSGDWRRCVRTMKKASRDRGRGMCGRPAPPEKPVALADAIMGTLEQSEAARRRALAGREHVLEGHSAVRLVREVDELYRELLAAKKAA